VAPNHHADPGNRATNTYSRLSSPNGSRLKPPYSASTSSPAASSCPEELRAEPRQHG